jgi:GT2 family glycosyltransferase
MRDPIVVNNSNDRAVGAKQGASVFAVVVTFDAPASALLTCISAIREQTRPPAAILVVDNHSSAPVDASALCGTNGARVEVLRLPENVGPAGGYSIGLVRFLQSECSYVWPMDDDVLPDPECLEHLLTDLANSNEHVVVGPVIIDTEYEGRKENWGWVGGLIPRSAVEVAGPPRADFFWGLEDQEYLRDRLPLAGFPLVRSEAATVRLQDRGNRPFAPWKVYYFSRNLVYQYLYGRRHLRLSVRLKSLTHGLIGLARSIWDSKTERRVKFLLFARAIADGVLGRLGKRITPDRADRPW